MADEKLNTNFISKSNTGFPEYLDFDKLRTEGIDYIGRLSGKIWTDHNVHDPGITILEILCYALLDLGYRTNLPASDIFTPDPEAPFPQRNFFTPAEILTCNPLTIIDFRKLLIDIDGVKNAWFETAKDAIDICRGQQTDPAGDSDCPDNCEHFLNGLYHVYIDLEKNIEKEFANNPGARDKYFKAITAKVKAALMAHRNLCEDFLDISFLCKLETGVCADIELQENADAEQVYVAVMQKLRNFFSPSPRFYTLQELLDKQKPIDEIFSGRPYNITESHGFVDTDELEQLKLKKEIHLSDVYHAIFEVEGVKDVLNLNLQFCKNGGIEQVHTWRFALPENHVPEFSVECSGFRFNRHGNVVFVDTQKFEGLLLFDFVSNGKIKYHTPSAYLDTEIPNGAYREDLESYYSIQNEFPRVYGIAAGGLPENAPTERKAQAFQLKGWLLFFDQLLANYLAQLKNIPSLFALSSPASHENHTYFIHQIKTVPDIHKLVKFPMDESNGNSLGTEGSILAFPVDRNIIVEKKLQGKLKSLSPEDIPPYTFSTLAAQRTIIHQIRNDLYFEQYSCEYVVKDNDCVYFYILTGSDEIALLGKRFYKDINEAKTQAASIQYIGSFEDNYRSFPMAGDRFSFDLELSLFSFSKYLQLILEDENTFIRRRQKFLDHLLSRFAEQFTDYALLAFGFQDARLLSQSEIRHKENYLTQYPELSSNRGKAYNYLENNWNNLNISGFEKKIQALSGIAHLKQKTLCNFEVAKYEERFEVVFKLGTKSFFIAEDKFDSEMEAMQAAQSIFEAMKSRANYQERFVYYDNNYQLGIRYASNRIAVFPGAFETTEETLQLADGLSTLFKKKKPEDLSFISAYIYIPELWNSAGELVRRSLVHYFSEDEAKAGASKSVKKINDRSKWQFEEGGTLLGKLYPIAFNTDHLSYIHTDAFKIDVNNNTIDQPEWYTYEVLDQKNSFRFSSARGFQTEELAKENAFELLALMTIEANYQIFWDYDTSKYRLRIENDGNIQAIDTTDEGSQTKEDAAKAMERVQNRVRKHQYDIFISQDPYRWRFKYQLGFEKGNIHDFESVNDFESKEEAISTASRFIDADTTLEVVSGKDQLILKAWFGNMESIETMAILKAGEYPGTKSVAVEQLLREKRDRDRLSQSQNPEDFKSSVQLDTESLQGLYVYRLIDKDRVPAFYSKNYDSKEEAKADITLLSKQFKYPDNYLRLCMGGEHIIHEIKDPATNQYWYHYLVKSTTHTYQHGVLKGQSIVLFESTKGYLTAEAAEQGFNEQYLYIVDLASNAGNYGTYISLTSVRIHHADSWVKNDSLVFVPEATVEELGPVEASVIQQLVNLSMSYPVRRVAYGSPDFYELFPCQKPEEIPEDASCKNRGLRFVYYFVLRSVQDLFWRSTCFYDNPEEAREEFLYFKGLLFYGGNYYVDCEPCNNDPFNIYHIYIHEVLAESTERFINEEEAWGNDGLQTFICIAQADDPFHQYQRKEDCCFSFYVSCRNSLIYHPCEYDTPQRRDEIMVKLYQALKGMIQQRSWQMEDNGQHLLLLNEAGEAFAAVQRYSDNDCMSDVVSVLVENAYNRNRYVEEESRIVLVDESHNILAATVNGQLSVAEWKKLLETFLCYYPVKKTRKEQNKDVHQYCVEIRLPGFNTCADDISELVPCGCGEEMVVDEPDCYIAWKSRCCFDSCAEAENALSVFIRLLLQFSYYQPVFDCECHAYGITLQFSRNAIIKNESISWFSEEAGVRNWINSEIVAVNPQCYLCKEEACEAVKRTRELINSEGLHLVEHILLRPRCPEDCSCTQYNRNCDPVTDCCFVWEVQNADPCLTENPVCFNPGSDPYSFVATVVLPAWPERFRKKENIALLENIIYREAPAHILLRILWLAPHDFCCFEAQYRKWNRWLAQKKPCTAGFSVCDFLEFLFERNYECLEDCSVCESCEEQIGRQPNCFAQSQQNVDPREYLNQINDLYCWRGQYCGEYQFIGCDSTDQQTEPVSPGVIMTDPTDQPELLVPGSTGFVKWKSQVVNARLAKYKKAAESLVKKSGSHPLALKTIRFLDDPHPEYDRLLKLVSEVLQNKLSKAKEFPVLSSTQKLGLLKNIICYWLDKHAINGNGLEELNVLATIFEKLEKAKVQTEPIFNYWSLPDILEFEPGLNESAIRSLFKLRKK